MPYRDVGLIPPAGPARTWGLTVIGVPLLLVLLLGLAGSLTHDDSGSAGAAGPYSGFGTEASAWPEASPTTAYASATADTTLPGDVFSASPESTTATSTAAAEPQAVVAAYFEAINNRDYQTAWDLGGKNLDADYATFAAGFATTQRDTINVVSVQGAEVRLTLDALSTDGTSHSYDAVYTVRDGEITSGTATPTT
jgi:hypothetical protein